MPSRYVRRAIKVGLAPVQWVRRRAAMDGILRQCSPPLKEMGHQIREQGYARFDARDLPHGEELLSSCRSLREEREGDLQQEVARRDGKLSIAIDLSTDFELQRRPLLLDFAMQLETCAPALAGLGTVPYLARVAVALSLPPDEPMQRVHFQRFHLDNDDLRHVKLYVNVEEVGADHGPLSFLPLKASQRVLRALRRGRSGEDYWTFDDEEVFQHASREELVRIEGPPGTGVYIDASRCLHFGSRVALGKERLVYGAVYMPYHRIKENVTSQIQASAATTAWQRLMLDPPKRYPLGTFFPDWGSPDRDSEHGNRNTGA